MGMKQFILAGTTFLMLCCQQLLAQEIPLEKWADRHPAASKELGLWVRNHPAAAHKLFEWDGSHPQRS
jgi:hypothetical protein